MVAGKAEADGVWNIMCGRFALGIPKQRLEEVFSTSMPDDYVPRYNIAPGQEVVGVTASGGFLCCVGLRWGLVPHWARDTKIGFKMINARSETVFDKPAFREPVRSARCLVPAQAFYEWKKTDSGKQPYAIGMADTDLFAMAGIMAHWEDAVTGEVVDSLSILTCAPNSLMESIHDRMPVILSPDMWSDWLDPAHREPEQLGALLKPFPTHLMRAWSVGTAVNKPVHDGPELLGPVQVLKQGSLF